MKKILLTGASGFLGQRIARYLENSVENQLSLAFRKKNFLAKGKHFCIGDINNSTDFSAALLGQDIVIHTAARVHIMRENLSESLPKFWMINVEGTLNLARQAVKAGVKRFIFISSIKVNGELTTGLNIFSEHDTPNPQDPYGLSKYEAEQGLLDIANGSDMEIVIIRPPLIYGPGVKGNFATLIKFVRFGFPLPLGLVDNRRSLVSLDNLVDLIVTCIDHPNARNQIFLVSDRQDVSSLELVKKIAKAFGTKSRTFPIPVALMMIAAKLIGKDVIADRLFCDLRVDSSKAEKLLEWVPIFSMDEQLKEIAAFEKLDINK